MMLGKLIVTSMLFLLLGMAYGEVANKTRSIPILGASKEEKTETKSSIISIPLNASRVDVTHSGREFGKNITQTTLNQTSYTIPETTAKSFKNYSESELPVNPKKVEDLTHKGREIAKKIKEDLTGKLDVTSESSIDLKITHNEQVPKYDVISEKNDGKPIVPKKGVVYDNFTFPINDTTEHAIAIVHESQAMKVKEDIPLNNSLHSVQHSTYHNIGTESFSMNSKFMLPLIGILFTLPLLGLIFVGVYKKGAEWWQHRHYRRMDFLIDGMYNN